MSNIVCQLCNTVFDSRNKLFKHVKVCATKVAVTETSQQMHQGTPTTIDDLFLYVVGGRQRGRTLRSVERYSFLNNSWEDCPQMLENRGSHGAASAKGILYAIGGGGFRSNLSSCECFDGKEWKNAAPLQVSRHALSVVESSNDTIYAVGGWIDGKECSPEVERFTASSNQWVRVAPLNLARKLHGVASLPTPAGKDDMIYAFGGNCEEPNWHTNTAEAYDPVSNRWSYIASMPAAGGASAASVLPFVFVFLHGKYVLRYDPKTNEYVKLSNLPLPDWHCFDVAVVPNSTHILALGGVTNGRWCRDMFRYDASDDTWTQLPSMRTARRRCASAIVIQKISESASVENEQKKQKVSD